MTPNWDSSGEGCIRDPHGERCIWMCAGLVAYKLCDRAFECDRCPFDAVMRGRSWADAFRPTDDGPLAAPPAPGREHGGVQGVLLFPADRAYHPAHTWTRRLESGRLRIGVDAFAGCLAGRLSAVVLPQPGTWLARGRVGCWLVDEGGPIPLRMPISGQVLRRNGLLASRPMLVAGDPYDEGWLIEVGWSRGGEGDPNGLLGPEEIGRLTERDLDWLEEHRRRAEQRDCTSSVGPTLADGGERLDLPRRIDAMRRTLGSGPYIQLVSACLSRPRSHRGVRRPRPGAGVAADEMSAPPVPIRQDVPLPVSAGELSAGPPANPLTRSG
jgi:glycine cleavage system H lipoate-binding protein